MATATATATRAIFCEAGATKSGSPRNRDGDRPVRVRLPESSPEGPKVMLQPRLCTLRSYGSGTDPVVMKTAPQSGNSGGDVAPFFASLAEYVESSRKSHDFEIVSGRLAMIVFASAVTMELVTGNSLFKKQELQQIMEAGGVCVLVVACASTFAWFSSARSNIGKMLTLGCNTFVDSLIDNIVDGLFYESELSDWSDEINSPP